MAKVQWIESTLDCGCEPDSDPYLLTTHDGTVFRICDEHWPLVRNVLEHEGVQIEGDVTREPRPEAGWRV